MAQKIVKVPKSLTSETIPVFLLNALGCDARVVPCNILFDFELFEWIDPVGVVVFSNLLEYLRHQNFDFNFTNHFAWSWDRNEGIIYLKDSLFFDRYDPTGPHKSAGVRASTIPLNFIDNNRSHGFLLNRLMPWISSIVRLSTDSIDSVRVSLDEIFHNVADHSGVKTGCCFAQHFPKLKEIHLAISDFGRGIPASVRTIRQNISDSEAVKLACEEGFTTKSNVQNRGAGLSTLIKYITLSNSGKVWITRVRHHLPF